MKSTIVLIIGLAMIAIPIAAQESDSKQAETQPNPKSTKPSVLTSENNTALKKALKKYPKADTNKDGVLTRYEAQQYRKKLLGKSKKDKPKVNPTHADIAYGPHVRNRLDLYIAESDRPTPVIVCIHGGGFKGGDKDSFHSNKQLIDAARSAGISLATVNYRLTDGGKHPYPIPMHDSARAVQFLRANAKKYNLDKRRFAATGGSAGGCMSMWLGFHDDMADPDSEDPVLRESTRLIAVAPNNGQSCLHLPTLLKWFDVKSLQEHGGGRPLFGVKPDEPLLNDQTVALSIDASPLTHVNESDPPCFMTFGANKKIDEHSEPGVWVHHPIMGFELQKVMKEKGLECHVKYKDGPETSYKNATEFLIEKLTK